MSYSFDSLVFKAPHSESPASLSEAVKSSALKGAFDNYDKQKTLGKSRHLSAATRLMSSTALKLIAHENVERMVVTRPHRVGVYIACENINLEDDFEFDLCAKNYGPDYVSPLKAPNTLANAVGSHFARFVGIKGPNCTVSSGKLGVFQALDMATMHIDSGAVESAIVGAVEVTSPYHAKLAVASREVAVASAIRKSQDEDTVVFYPPATWTANEDITQSVAVKLSQLSARYLEGADIDEIWIVRRPWVSKDKLVSALSDCGFTTHVLVFSESHLDGECANGLLLTAMAQETLASGTDELDVARRTVAIVDTDASGQVSMLLMEGR
ncbi:beta-ketoacyl synthase N-terminal-like domain-containing protein [Enterovibrio sp. 27052020O]|uniref:beta-ketoacyl synthase N-terminal-like domain-containing protein n=1 Tax=Enterovibrio sp. 27052020O TaxID=3241166 RepID=UPI00388FD450